MIASLSQPTSGTLVRLPPSSILPSNIFSDLPCLIFSPLDNWKFNLAPDNGAKIFPGITVQSVAATDFNHDGHLDLLVQGFAPQDNLTTVLQIWLGDLKNLSTSSFLVSNAVIATVCSGRFPHSPHLDCQSLIISFTACSFVTSHWNIWATPNSHRAGHDRRLQRRFSSGSLWHRRL
jgi:hypothetical protein